MKNLRYNLSITAWRTREDSALARFDVHTAYCWEVCELTRSIVPTAMNNGLLDSIRTVEEARHG